MTKRRSRRTLPRTKGTSGIGIASSANAASDCGNRKVRKEFRHSAFRGANTFPVKSEVLENSNTCNEETEQHREPEKLTPILQTAERLRSQKQKHKVREQQEELETRLMRRFRSAKKPLKCGDACKCEKRRQTLGSTTSRTSKSTKKAAHRRKIKPTPVSNTARDQSSTPPCASTPKARSPQRAIRTGFIEWNARGKRH